MVSLGFLAGLSVRFVRYQDILGKGLVEADRTPVYFQDALIAVFRSYQLRLTAGVESKIRHSCTLPAVATNLLNGKSTPFAML